MKTLLVWLLLLAVPFQGFASATMLVCAPISSSAQTLSKVAAKHDDKLASKTESGKLEHCAQMAAQARDDVGNQPSGHPAGMKCSACALCHVAVAIASHNIVRLQLDVQPFSTIPFDQGFIADVDLDLPERPPQAILS